MSRTLSVITVFVALGLSGVVSGYWTQRWSASAGSDGLKQATQLPLTAGEWDSREKPVNPAEIQMAQAAAIVQRVYVNSRTGQVATVMLISGRAGPISVHTPEVCYSGNGYDPEGAASRFSISGDHGNQFWRLRLKKHAAVPVLLSVYYAWNDGSGWQAAEKPRVLFAGRSAIFKLYVVRERTAESETETDDSTRDLLRVLLPSLNIPTSPN